MAICVHGVLLHASFSAHQEFTRTLKYCLPYLTRRHTSRRTTTTAILSFLALVAFVSALIRVHHMSTVEAITFVHFSGRDSFVVEAGGSSHVFNM